MATNHRSPRQLLENTPSYPCLYRHKRNGVYYGAKKVSGKRKENSPVRSSGVTKSLNASSKMLLCTLAAKVGLNVFHRFQVSR
jgi:hypothetical protein